MSVLPYENEQFLVHMNNKDKYIERIPMICDPSTGAILPEFQCFYDALVKGVCTSTATDIYNISDKSMKCEDFVDLYNSKIGDKIKDTLQSPENTRKIDIELNISRFQKNQRNIVGSFLINTYVLKSSSNSLLCYENHTIQFQSAEIFFTYRNSQFQIISAFEPLITSSVND